MDGNPLIVVRAGRTSEIQSMRSTPVLSRHHGVLVRATLLTALLAAAFLSACDKNTLKPTPRPVDYYPVLSTPQNVLAALQLAYIFRDSVEYKALHDSSYAGTSTDQTAPPGTPLQFTFADEVAHIVALARSNTVSRVRLSLGSPAAWTRLPSDDMAHPDWAMIQIPGANFDVEVTDGANTFSAGGAMEFLQFKFQPATPDSTSPTDTTWKIIRWTEVRSF